MAWGLYHLYVLSKQEAPVQCQVCRRPIPAGTAFSSVEDEREVRFCCPRCWITSQRARDGKYRRPTATDYVSGKTVPAERCVYVEGGNISPCCAPMMTIGADKMPAVQCFDRCSPSTIAFADPQEALSFSKEHGGTIVSFQTLVDEAKKP